MEQFKPTEENIEELRQASEAVAYIYLLKKAEYEETRDYQAKEDKL